jgi:hypothetical protein
MMDVKSVCLNYTWICLDNGITTNYMLTKMTKKTATFIFVTSHNLSGTIKATHVLDETEDGLMSRLFTLYNHKVLKYDYKPYSHPNIKVVICEELPHVFSQYVRNIECPICYDNTCDILTSCGHSYCKECFEKITECAMCKLPKTDY